MIAAVVLLAVVGVAAVMMTMRSDVGDASVTVKTPDASGGTSVVASQTPTGSKPEVEAPTLKDRAWSVGQPVRDGNFEFVLVKMTVTNIGTDPQTFFASFNKLSDGSTEYQSDDEAWIYLGNTLADLNPGDSIDTAVVFDVPVGTTPDSIELHDGPFSDGVTVGL